MEVADMDQSKMTDGKTQKGGMFAQGQFVWKGCKSVSIFLNIL